MITQQSAAQDSWIRINQMGYLPNAVKVAVWVSKEGENPGKPFVLRDAKTGKVVFRKGKTQKFGAYAAFKTSARFDFSAFTQEGEYFLQSGSTKSPVFRINAAVYDNTADFILQYMRQQRCGYNPFLQDSCHTQDGFRVFHPSGDSAYINTVGGWHDATDYLQYVTTSANATFQMLFAYEHHPEAFGDAFDANGNPGKNNIPDILDEAKWGLDWLLRMNPAKTEMYNQLADDRDHVGYRLPNHDKVSYGKGLERPVYFATGKPQGSFAYKNRATGIASTAGKYASAYSLGAQLLAKYYPNYAQNLEIKAQEAYAHGLANPGVCQTAPGRAPYFYEEDNWVDDMELAAIQLSKITKRPEYLEEARRFGQQEPVTPWMGADTARHYQWYPFLNLGHYYLATQSEADKQIFAGYLKKGLEGVYNRGKNNPFLMGVPFIWCSNNLMTALVTQCYLYRQLTKDNQFAAMEASLRDWLFGCNPWGTSMIIGLPEKGIYPKAPHSSLTKLNGYELNGGLVDGPVYGSIYNNLKGIALEEPDEFSPFQSPLVVYHDDFGDYSTNEPTMDGTASLSFYLSAMQKEGQQPVLKKSKKKK
ncbi:MAG: glycoside hydrolase family 9 protein [Adhaeribacter sp.]